MGLLPTRCTDGTLIDGHYIKALDFCNHNCNSDICDAFYKNVTKKECFVTCPHGMSVFVTEDGTVFTCMSERKSYCKEKAKKIRKGSEKVYNPILDQEQLLRLIEADAKTANDNRQLEEKRAAIDSISHEVKQLNAQIKDRSDLILQTYHLLDDVTLDKEDLSQLQEDIRTIFVSSAMISGRFSLYDYEKNPTALSQGSAFPCVVYKKFDKIRKIFKNYQRRAIQINITGSSFAQIMAYPSFEMIPLLIIENAIKYTYSSESPVEVHFEEEANGRLRVSVTSYSPYCSSAEIAQIFNKGYRGKNAKMMSAGSGIGLYFVKTLCDLHNIAISVTSDTRKITNISGINYAPFELTLLFSNVIM